MQRWEYKTIKLETKGFCGGILDIDQLDDRLNKLGEAGWELTTSFATSQGHGASREVIITFKRPL